MTNLNNFCSSDAEYTTVGGTPDLNAGSCWNNSGPQFNRWFYFTAIHDDATITIDRGGSKGNQTYTQLALWEADGTTEVACQRYSGTGDDVSISASGLTVGNVYYVSVDTYNTSTDGTFTFCIDNVDTEYYSIADGDWDDPNTWSIVSHAGAPAASFPTNGDIVYIQGHDVNVDVASSCAELNITIADSKSALTIDGATLTVNGAFNMTNPGNDLDGTVILTNGGDLDVNDDVTISRSGGANIFSLTAGSGSVIDINGDVNINSSAGTVNENLITLNTGATMSISGDLLFNNTGGVKTTLALNNTSALNVNGDITFTATGDDEGEIELNNSSTLNLAGGFNRGTPAYGILDCNGTSTVTFDGNSPQVIAESAGSGSGDTFDYFNLIINNSFGSTPQLSLEGDVTIDGTLTLIDGIVASSSSAYMIMESGSSKAGGSAASFVDGPMIKTGVDAFEFPIGDGTDYAPIAIGVPSGAETFTAEYFPEEVNPSYDTALHEISIDHISNVEYWILDRAGSESAVVTLSWDNDRSGGVTAFTDLVVCRWDGAEWDNHGGVSHTGNNSSGTVTSSAVITDFSPFTLGSITSENPLPIELISFDATVNEDKVDLKWVTASEINNNYFSVERSVNGLDWETVLRVEGAGNSTTLREYFEKDANPIVGESYYRLKQTDHDGAATTSGAVAVKYLPALEPAIVVYPNPNDGMDVNLRFEGLSSAKEVLVVLRDVTGKEVYQKVVARQESDGVHLDLTKQLPAGTYLVIASSEDKLVSTQLIVQ